MQQENYLSCSAYENHVTQTTEHGFTIFQNPASQLHFFALLDDNGKVLLKSEGYPQPAARDNGIQSVIKNRKVKEFYSVKEHNGKYFLSLHSANYREIARSCDCDTENAALELLPFITGEQKRNNFNINNSNSTMTTNTPSDNRHEDDYLACSAYENHQNVGVDGLPGLVSFTHANGLHYFAYYDDANHLLMRSEGYTTTAARNNGMVSVEKNRDIEERYSVEEKMGHFFTILKAGNHQEIAKSCAKNTHADALALFPSKRAEAARLKEQQVLTFSNTAQATVVTGTTTTTTVTTNEHHRHEDNYSACHEYENHGTPDTQGFTKWQSKNGEYYFTWHNADGTVKMRSEGYKATAARDGGMESVITNRDIRDRYSVEEIAHRYFVILKAGNHQEIARSCPYMDMNMVFKSFGLLGTYVEPKAETPMVAPVAAVVLATVAGMAPIVEIPTFEIPKVEIPKIEVLPVAIPVVAVAVAAAIPKVELPVVEVPVVTAAIQIVEIPKVEIPVVAAAVAAAIPKVEIPKVEVPVVAAAVAAAIPKVEIPKVVVPTPAVALPKIELPVVEVPKIELPKVAVPVAAAAIIAAAAMHKPEVKKEEVKVVREEVRKSVIPPVYTAPVVEEAKAGFNWWWLSLLLLPLLWLAYKSCNQPVAMSAPVVAPIAVEAPKQVAITPAAAPVITAPSCDLNWIFFDYDKSDIRSDANASLDHLVTLMKQNTASTTLLKAFTDGKGTDGYNEALSLRRATAAKAYLMAHGIAADRIKTDHLGKTDSIASNTTDDTGRKFNRRVEIYLKDKDGKNICQSVEPIIPTNLKK